MMANRREIARRISKKTGYYVQDILTILESEDECTLDLLSEGYTKIKHHKLYQLELKLDLKNVLMMVLIKHILIYLKGNTLILNL